jgi:hypothetical protein
MYIWHFGCAVSFIQNYGSAELAFLMVLRYFYEMRKCAIRCLDFSQALVESKSDVLISLIRVVIFHHRKMTFDLHMNDVILRSMSMLGFLKRFGRKFSDTYFLKIIYCSFVRFVFEYGSSICTKF